MKFKQRLAKKFAIDNSGAVTVDWVVLTAFIAGSGLALTAALEPQMQTQSEGIVSRAEISTDF